MRGVSQGFDAHCLCPQQVLLKQPNTSVLVFGHVRGDRFFTALRVFSLMRLDRVTNEVTSRTPVSPWGGLDTSLPSSLSASFAHCLLFPQESRGFLWFSPFLVSYPVSSAIFSFSFGSETGDHGTASTLVSMVDEGGGGVQNFVFLLCLFRYASALSFQGVHIHRMLEYFLVFQLGCFFEDISIVRL